jgi:hypothetical protein
MMTNGDKIRAMLTDEVIAKRFFCMFYDICSDCPIEHAENCISIEERMKWLQSEVNEDARTD